MFDQLLHRLRMVDTGGGDSTAGAMSEAGRFAARSADRFPFLHPAKLKDAAGNRPRDAGYNPRTLWLPPNWFKTAKVQQLRYSHSDHMHQFKAPLPDMMHS